MSDAPPTSTVRVQVFAWSLWDWASQSYDTVILTFVFSVYLTTAVSADETAGAAQLGWTLTAAGALMALTAPVIGQRADATGRRKLSTGIWSLLTILSMAGLFFVENDQAFLVLGLVLLGLGSIFSNLAAVSYNAMLTQISTPANVGRISGFGWAMGYVGGIVVLMFGYIGFIAGEGDVRGLFGVPTADGFNIRLVALVAAAWFLVFAIPLFLAVPETPPQPDGQQRLGVGGSYRKLFLDLRDLYRANPHTVYFLGASALYRDGLAAIFTFGAVLAVQVYGIAADDVLIFGAVASVVSAIGAFGGGLLEDRAGPKLVIMASLVGMVVAGIVLLGVSGPGMFWVFGLFLTLFVGSAQSSSRTFLARLTPAGHESQMFGLYATTGRAVSFLSPMMVAIFTSLFGAVRAGIAGIVIVLALGAITLVLVQPPARAALTTSKEL
ncbi:MFS transporter [Pseudonocardia sp. TRM90224]|uniref:MFS transporter n=1 Tax=Pseudonocardia sp. TRM90224 TaxID=2812678 RepID=UPI001E394C79|nr:MFS transporter [Pseudonocardia sp. TRM90224]